MKWSSFATAVLILLMALTHGTPALFLPITVVTFFAFGERCAIDFGCAVVLVAVDNPRLKFRVCFGFDRLVHTRAIDPLLPPEENAVLHDARIPSFELGRYAGGQRPECRDRYPILHGPWCLNRCYVHLSLEENSLILMRMLSKSNVVR